MSKWRLGRMRLDDMALKKGQMVAVKKNDDLTKPFLVENFVVFNPKVMQTSFLTRKAIPTYVELTGKVTPQQEEVLEKAWPVMREQIIRRWKKKHAN